MDTSTVQPLRIGAIGLDERHCNALKMIFDGACRKGFCFAENRPPEAWIVDLDHVGAADTLARNWKSHGKLPTVVLSINTPGELEVDGEKVQATYLKKPFRVDDFVAALRALAKSSDQAGPGSRATAPAAPPAPATGAHRIHDGRIACAQQTARVAELLDDEASASLVGNAADVDLADPTQCEPIYYAPERFLQGRIAAAWQRAKATARPLAFEGAWPTIVLFPNDNKVQLSAALRQYRPFAIVPDLQGEPRETALNPNVKPTGECLSYEAFVWTLALWASRGRLPQGTPLDLPVFLRWWPNFTRLDVSPSALAIAALWSRHPHSLALSVELLQLPQRRVFAFYSAANAIGLAEISRRAVDQMALPNPPTPTVERRRGFFSRVLDKLKLAN